jgi:hypothetical protein
MYIYEAILEKQNEKLTPAWVSNIIVCNNIGSTMTTGENTKRKKKLALDMV